MRKMIRSKKYLSWEGRHRFRLYTACVVTSKIRLTAFVTKAVRTARSKTCLRTSGFNAFSDFRLGDRLNFY